MRRAGGEGELLGGEDVVGLSDSRWILGQLDRRVADPGIGSGERELLGGEHVMRRQIAGIPPNRPVTHRAIFPDPEVARFANPQGGQ